MMTDGKLILTPAELAAFLEPVSVQPVAPHLWLINTTTGETRVVRGSDYTNLPDGWALLMTGPDPAWVEQWGGDLQRACDVQLNPLLDEAFNQESV